MRRGRWRITGALLVLCVVTAACSELGAGSDETSTTIFDPELVVTVPDHLPFEELVVINVAVSEGITNFNTSTNTGAGDWGRTIMQSVWPVGTRTLPDFTVEPVFFAELPRVISEDPFIVRYELRPDAMWSDGVPVSVSDMRFYFDHCNSYGVTDSEGVVVEPRDDCVNIADYSGVTEFVEVDSRVAHVTFAAPCTDYLTLFSEPMPPAHVGADWSDGFEQFDERVMPAAGPFRVADHLPGVEVQLVRNDSWFGDRPQVDGLSFQVIENEFAQVDALESGEIDLISVDAQIDLLRAIDDVRNITTSSAFGSLWEQVTFNNETVGLRVRQAITLAIDRDAIAQDVVRAFGSGGKALGSRVYVPGQEFYVDNTPEHFESADVAQARAILELDGYVVDETGMYVDEDERPLTLRIRTTGGNARREQVEQLIRIQLAEAGIHVVVDNLDGKGALGPIFAGDFDLAVYAWEGSSQPAGIAQRIFSTDSTANAGSYANNVTDDKLAVANGVQDPAEQSVWLNEADEIMWVDLPSVPLYQVPTLVAYNDDLMGIEDNATHQGVTWDVTNWAWEP